MTGEIHSIIVKAGMKALKMIPKQERRKLLDKQDEKWIKWVEKHPCFRSSSEDTAMKFLESDAAKLLAYENVLPRSSVKSKTK